jgi:hypothetical protein
VANPFEGFLINGTYYHYEQASYSRTREILTRTDLTQEKRRAVSTLGIGPLTHSVTVILENTYLTVDPETGNASIGETTWLGLSRLAHLESMLGYRGSSLPLIIVTPYGTTHLVVPKGVADETPFLANPNTTGVEWRVSLSFEDLQ